MSKLLTPLHAMRQNMARAEELKIIYYIAKNFFPTKLLPIMFLSYQYFNTKKLQLHTSLQDTLYQISKFNQLVLKSYIRDISHGPDDEWKFICDSSSIKMTTGFYAQIWINNKYKQLIYTCAGTKVDFLTMNCSIKTKFFGILDLFKDAVNDVRIFLHQPPLQYKYGMEPFIEWSLSHLSKLGINLKEHDIFFTGHSLGAMLADMGALYMHKYIELSVKSVTMENPGSLHSIMGLAGSLKKAGHLFHNLEELKDNFIVFNNTPNWVNTAGEQFGRVYQLVTCKSQPAPTFVNYLPFSIQHIIQTAITHFESHDKAHFDNIMKVFHVEEWPTGLFDDFLREYTDPFRKKFQSAASYISSWVDTGLSLCIGSVIIGDIVTDLYFGESQE